jgi:hypothetical protein
MAIELEPRPPAATLFGRGVELAVVDYRLVRILGLEPDPGTSALRNSNRVVPDCTPAWSKRRSCRIVRPLRSTSSTLEQRVP